MIADGVLPAGTRIVEGELAERLDVSRTPVREALSRLTADGFVESRPRRGFFVQAMDEATVRELYGVRSILDPGALEMAGLPSESTLARLAELNEAIVDSAGDVERVIDLDDEWHLTLVAGCGNGIVLDFIRQFMWRTRPLERAYLRFRGGEERMVEEHDRIMKRLEGGDLSGAVAALRQNMRSGLEPMLDWLESARPTAAEMARRAA